MEYVLSGEIVEGAHCDIVTRKHKWIGLRKDPITNSLMMLYELERNCSVEVTKVMTYTDDELNERIKERVHFLLGDKLVADRIQLYVKTIRNNVQFEVKEGQSGRHGAQLAHTTDMTIGKIKYALETHSKLMPSNIKQPKALQQ